MNKHPFWFGFITNILYPADAFLYEYRKNNTPPKAEQLDLVKRIGKTTYFVHIINTAAPTLAMAQRLRFSDSIDSVFCYIL